MYIIHFKRILKLFLLLIVILFLFSIDVNATPIIEHKVLEVPEEFIELAKSLEEFTSNENDLIILGSTDKTKFYFIFLQKAYDYKAYLRCRDLRGHCKLELGKYVGFSSYSVLVNDLASLKSVDGGLSISFYADGYEDTSTGEHSLFLYSTVDIYTDNTYSEIFYTPKEDIELTLGVSTTQPTYDPIEIFTNWLPETTFDNLICEYSTDDITYIPCSSKSLTNADTGVTEFAFYTTVNKNGAYYFRYKYKDETDYKTITMNITNIINLNFHPFDDNPLYYQEDILMPFLGYEYIDTNHILVYTQWISEEISDNIICEYSTDGENYTQANIRSLNNSKTGVVEYSYYVDAYEDATYYFRFYNTKYQKYTGESSITILFDKIEEYQKNQETVNESTSYFDQLINFFSSKFGFLTYPFELIYTFFDKVFNIDFQEPIIKIPDIYEPFSNKKLVVAIDYNLNSLLVNNTFKTVHDIYFILVDAILIFAFINLAKNKIMGVFSK